MRYQLMRTICHIFMIRLKQDQVQCTECETISWSNLKHDSAFQWQKTFQIFV